MKTGDILIFRTGNRLDYIEMILSVDEGFLAIRELYTHHDRSLVEDRRNITITKNHIKHGLVTLLGGE